MKYVDGFVVAVPKANREVYKQYSEKFASIFKEFGALNMVECWGKNVPQGKLKSFPMAVQCKDDEVVVFSWLTWPSKEARNDAWKKLEKDPRFNPENNPMPFDGKRMIYGCFEVLVDA